MSKKTGVAISVAERLCACIARTQFSKEDGALIRFTVSIGFTIAQNGSGSVEELLKTIDEALYLAKKQGRNRVAMLELPVHP